ncbi:DUF695 domain-containing protein [Paraflavitalea speifideaquila]|uniref:DUF695 domain-containing protein n=1 Tax=Paraflavitalea speifideaquila TaxID=3076558 RepID=UPI0028E48772|nr:DUF695 domain-containing protein [Paraflavitalea speifideiaquila]
MNFLKKLLGSKDKIITTDYKEFWDWFLLQEQPFHDIVKNKKNIDAHFLNKLMPQLQQINKQFYCLTGMYDENTVELVITAEGDIKTFVFVEELVATAPALPGWKFTALKPSMGNNQSSMTMNNYTFNHDKIQFFSTIEENYPDEIDITLIHADFRDADEQVITNGTLIYLDNALGELNVATLIDSIQVTGSCPPDTELIPLDKLEGFLLWREKEFIEKYKGSRRDTQNDKYAMMQAQDADKLLLIAIINSELLNWDAKASHPWMLVIDIDYRSVNNGMPGNDTSELLNQFEDDLTPLLPDQEGYLNLGRQTYNNTRTIYFACQEYRQVSKIVAGLIERYKNKLSISYEIYKDKYWKTMNRFQRN